MSDALIIAVEDYLKEVENQSPIVPTSHLTLIRLVRIWGAKDVRAEIYRQLYKKREV
tara:strand:+ start:328 stop:498 length:171 start_codon:yes stop_codon:yes gene_type:complete